MGKLLYWATERDKDPMIVPGRVPPWSVACARTDATGTARSVSNCIISRYLNAVFLLASNNSSGLINFAPRSLKAPTLFITSKSSWVMSYLRNVRCQPSGSLSIRLPRLSATKPINSMPKVQREDCVHGLRRDRFLAALVMRCVSSGPSKSPIYLVWP